MPIGDWNESSQHGTHQAGRCLLRAYRGLKQRKRHSPAHVWSPVYYVPIGDWNQNLHHCYQYKYGLLRAYRGLKHLVIIISVKISRKSLLRAYRGLKLSFFKSLRNVRGRLLRAYRGLKHFFTISSASSFLSLLRAYRGLKRFRTFGNLPYCPVYYVPIGDWNKLRHLR